MMAADGEGPRASVTVHAGPVLLTTPTPTYGRATVAELAARED